MLGLFVPSLSAQNVEFKQISSPAGVVNQVSYPLLGSQTSTVTAPATSAGNRFTHWTLNGVRVSYATGRGANPVVFKILDPTEAVANYVLETLDSDSDGIADWYEIHYFGDLSRNLAGDSDGDGFAQAVELTRDYDPAAKDEIVEGGVSRRFSAMIPLVIPDPGLLDTDRDGFIQRVETLRGYRDDVVDQLDQGGASRRCSPAVYAVVNSNFVRLAESSTPAGVFAQERVVAKGSTVILYNAPLVSNGYRYTGWFVDGVRIDRPPQNQPIPLTITQDTRAIARYILETADTDADGIPDWLEWNFFESLSNTLASDPDGDAIPWSLENFRGYPFLARDELMDGGVSRRDSGLVDIDTTGQRLRYRMVSQPAGMVNQQGLVPPGTVVTSPDLKSSVSGNHKFAYWTVNGVRQTDASGYSRSQASFAVAQPSLATAYYIDSTLDDDFDGLSDWYEWAYFGTLERTGSNDGDNDGLSLAGEVFRGYSPQVRDFPEAGGVSRRNSILTAVNTVQLSVPPYVVVNGATDVTPVSARLNALVNGAGLDTTVYFEHGLTAAYGSRTPVQSLVRGNVPRAADALVTDLQAATVYHFRVVAENAKGVTTSPDVTFSTLWDAVVAEGFEGAGVIGRWQLTGGVWAVGPLPGCTGAAGAATGLAGSYSANSDSRFISPLFEVPALSQFPHLRFDHRCDFGSGDAGTVEIREGATGVWQLAATFTGRFPEWMEKSLDLSAFAGRRIQVAFRIQTNADASRGAGWWLDNVRLATGEIDEWLANTPDDFAMADFWRNWTVVGAAWECGLPTAGPATAFEGTTCAATNLGGNYAANSNSRLVSPFFRMPAAELNPRLRFWHWFQFGSGDQGLVEARTLGGPWQTLASFSDVGGSAWTRPAVDLSGYAAGQWVQVGFHLVTNGWDERAGWYLDQAQIVTGADVVNNPETFDSAIGDWRTDTNGLWQIGRPASGPQVARSGNNAAATNLSGNYPANSVARLESPAFEVGDPGPSRLVTLQFWQWHQFGTGDQGELQIAVAASGGMWSQWVTLQTVTGSSGGWREETADLSAYKGKTVRLGFLLAANDDASTGPGWYLDDIAITSVVLGDFAPAIPVRNSVTTDGERQFYALNLTTSGPLRINLDLLGTGAATGLYIRRGSLPTLGSFDYRGAVPASGDQCILIPLASEGTYYVMVHAPDVTSPSDFVLTATEQILVVESVSPGAFDTRRDSVLTLTGAGFQSGTMVTLTGATTVSPTETELDSQTTIRAHFPAGTVAAGTYSVRVEGLTGTPVVIPEAVEFKATGVAKLVANLVTPSQVGRNTPATIFIEYRNDGDAPMTSPLVSLSASGQSLLTLDQQALAGGLWTSAVPQGFSGNTQFLADDDGVLNPGETVLVPVYFAGLRDNSATQVDFQLGALLAGNPTPVDWAGLKEPMRPTDIPAEAWDILWANFLTIAGNTWGGYAEMLGQGRAYLNGLRIVSTVQPVTDTGTLLSHRFLVANGLCPVGTLASGTDAALPAPGLPLVFGRSFPQGIVERFALGDLGRGWFHGWDLRAVPQADGAVEIAGPGPARRMFEPDTRNPGRFLTATDGAYGTVELSGGTYRLREKDGTAYQFRSDQRLGYVEDTNANRITLAYGGGRLTGLGHTNGSSLTIGYHTSGRIKSVTDSLGRATTYDYDAAAEHLVTVTEADGRVTRYGYNTTAGSPSRHALVSIIHPDQTVRNFGYDSRGWLASASRAGGAEAVSFGYDGMGKVTSTDALGHTSVFFFDERGRIVKARNPLGHSVRMAFDRDSNLVSITDPAGRSHGYAYDAKGNLRQSVDPLGALTRFTYTAGLNRLASVTDANGNLTNYGYDAKGNLKSITYADTSHEDWDYDTTGNPQTWTNRRGRAVGFEYDSAGRVKKKTYADGTTVTFEYDTRGNLDYAIDPHGTTDLEYDAKDRLTKITYPGNRWLEFGYDPAGRRVSSLDQLGHKLEYFYDTHGRLWYMTDETSAEIVRYQYDTLGRVARKTLGNGVYTTYEYDAAGQLLHLVNLKSDNSVLSRFDYTYDSRGRRMEMNTHYGKWTYGYDDLGQLTRAVLTSTDPEIPNQDLTYIYDKLGNRIRTVENGVTRAYTTNNLNQYTKVGDTTYIFDLDGNLKEERAPGGTTVYAYNDENRMIGVTKGPDSWTYTYDAFGQRVASSENGEVTEYVIDPVGLGNVVGEYRQRMPVVRPMTFVPGLMLVDDSGGRHYHVLDALGSIAGVTGEQGEMEFRMEYSPLGGTLRNPSSNPKLSRQFIGGYGSPVDPDGGIYMNVRQYWAKLGRFTTCDPTGLFGGVNLYGYCGNNPVSLIDPTGRGPVKRLIWRGIRKAAWFVTSADNVIEAVSFNFDVFNNVYEPYVNGSWALWYQGDDGKWKFDWVDKKTWERSVDYGWLDGQGRYHPPQTRDRGFSPPADWGGWDWWKNGHPPDALSWTDFTPLDVCVVPVIVPRDPNDCLGPAGYGLANFLPANTVLPYRVRFENDKDAAAPAQAVVVTDNLNANLDWSTFRITEIGFGDQFIPVPPNSQYFETQHACTVNGHELLVDIFAGIDPATGQAYCRFYSVDPATGLPPTVDIGLLPPEDGTGRGKGWFSFIVKPKAGLPSGTAIRNVALIKFDANDPIATNQIDPHNPAAGTDPTKEALVTLDDGPPTVTLTLTPTGVGGTNIDVRWTGDDHGGVGIESYDVEVSVDSGPFTPWLTDTLQTQATYPGYFGQQLQFRVSAGDFLGQEAQPVTATTVIVNDDYLAWRSERFGAAVGDPAQRNSLWGDDADPDSDGRSNVLEFLDATDPRVADAQFNPTTRVEGGSQFYTYRMTKGVNHLIDHYVQWSPDTIRWFTGGLVFRIIEDHGDYTMMEAELTLNGQAPVLFRQLAARDVIYNHWIYEEGATFQQRGPQADPNADGIANALAYALGLPAMGPVPAADLVRVPKPVTDPSDPNPANHRGGLEFGVPARLQPDVTLIVEASPTQAENSWVEIVRRTGSGAWLVWNGTDWQPPDGRTVRVGTTVNPGWVSTTITEPLTVPRFYRLRAVIAE
jgi:RHS repeat-associated protein